MNLQHLYLWYDHLPIELQLLLLTMGVACVLVGALAIVLVLDHYTNPIFPVTSVRLQVHGGSPDDPAAGTAQPIPAERVATLRPSVDVKTRDRALFRDQVREDVQRSLRAFQGGRRS